MASGTFKAIVNMLAQSGHTSADWTADIAITPLTTQYTEVSEAFSISYLRAIFAA